MKNIEVIAPHTTLALRIEPEFHNNRIDTFLSEQFPSYSRTYFKRLLTENHITLNEKSVTKPSTLVRENDTLSVTFPPEPHIEYHPVSKEANIDAHIIHTHPHFIIVNKPANLIVHKTASALQEPSLVDWLLTDHQEIKNVGSAERPGIVHRLDKLTSGIMIVTRNNPAHALFSSMFKDRLMHKTYHAIVHGHPEKTGTIDLPIGKEKNHRTKMCHSITGRASTTNYRVIEYYEEGYSLVEVKPVTGRTHQIRVHFAAIGHPLLGDVVYGTPSKLLNRQALHAYSLSFEYENNFFSFKCELPEDLTKILKKLTPIR